ncbi:MAG: hypothetical protein WBI40_12455, partial [Methylococcaceae bacterium]
TLDNFEKSHIFGSDAYFVIEHIGKEDALNHLKAIVSAWYQNRNAVLPVAIGTAFEYLSTQNLGKAKAKYEGGFNQGELDTDAYLKRLFPTFDELNANGEFEHFANELYLPIQQNASEA